MDDNKISHKDPEVVSNIIEKMEEYFGKMVVTRGKEHTFLGMKMRFNGNGTVSISMKDQCEEAINAYPEKIKRMASTPARKDLFTVDDESPRLDGMRSDVLKLAFISKRGRMDLETSLGFLRTRVSKSTEQDWDKLRRVLEFLSGTIDDELTLGADGLALLLSFVDVSLRHITT